MNTQHLMPENQSWWLRLTAPRGTETYAMIPDRQQRDRLRKAGLISGIIPFVFFAPLLLSGQANDPGTLIAIIVSMITAIVALVLNRAGFQTAAALLLIFSMDGVIENGLLRAPGGIGNAWLLTFDLFLLPAFLSGMLLSRRAIWLFLTLHVSLILGDFFLLPHTEDLTLLIQQWGLTVGIARPLILQIGLALLSYFQIRSTDQAVARADKAEEIANLEHQIAEKNKEVEIGIRELSGVLTHAANGQFNVQANIKQGQVLWQLASQVNNLLARLKTSRQLDATLRQADVEVARLTQAVQATRIGKSVVWPLPSGSIIDPLITELRNLFSSQSKTIQETQQTPPSQGTKKRF